MNLSTISIYKRLYTNTGVDTAFYSARGYFKSQNGLKLSNKVSLVIKKDSCVINFYAECEDARISSFVNISFYFNEYWSL